MSPRGSRFDVVVIGAGPAGSAAALAAARQGASTLLLEKHATIGTPLCCAEAVSTSGLTDVLGTIEPRWTVAPIDEVEVYAPDGTCMHLRHPRAGFVLDRKVFDRDLAMRAEQAGAEVRVESPAVALEPNANGYSAVLVQTPDGLERVATQVIIAADGIESQVGRWAGLDTHLDLDQLESGAQFRLEGIGVTPGRLEFYMGRRVAPGGYAWVFPRGPDNANVGLAVTPSLAAEKNARVWLEEFVGQRFGSQAHVSDEMYGGIPVFLGHRLLRRANVLLVGDAARLVDSISGAGIANALRSGDLAGRAAAAYVQSGQSRDLDLYARRWRLQKARQMRLYRLARDIFLRLEESDLNLVVRKLGQHFEGRSVSHIDPVEVIKMIFRFHRPLLRLVRHLEW